jgi:CelD/BcsL family acetyltransferase involved in cellulose biosynthesis
VLTIRPFADPNWATMLKEDWQELQQDSFTATPFQTWEWMSTWHQTFGGKPLLLLAYDEELLVGILPLILKRGAWTTLRSMGAGPSDYLHPLIRTGHEPEAWEAFLNAFHVLSPLADIHQISERGVTFENPGLENATCLVVDLPDDFETYLSRLSKSLRYDVRKLDKKLFAEGKARIYEPEDLGEGLDILFEQHRKRWRSRGLPGAFFGKTERFHREWAALARSRGWLRLRILEYEGKPIGAIYAMTFNGVCYYYQAGFDPAHSAISPGTLLVAHTIREAIGEGVKQFDFCRGDEPYKRRWQPDHVWINRRLILAPTPRARVGEAYLKKAWTVEEKLRARLEGGSLFGKKPS